MGMLEDTLALYDFPVPPDLVAQTPANPRDSARLLVYDPGNAVETIDSVRHIGDYLPPHSLVVLNDTKVIPARLELRRPTGGLVEALFTSFHGNPLRALLSRSVPEGERLTAPGGRGFIAQCRDGQEWLLCPDFPLTQLPVLLKRHGHAPLPPYIKHSTLTEGQTRERYQSVFAAHPGSIAAPTASLHLTRRLLAALRKKGVQICTVTLHVHLGTFLPLREEQLQKGRLHREEYFISKKTISALHKAKKTDQKIIAVGTTALRTLESAANAKGEIVRSSGATDLFIREGYRFRMADGLLTNFHVPKSSLLMLVAAFIGREEMLRLYDKGIANRMRLFSFGDAMLLLPQNRFKRSQRRSV